MNERPFIMQLKTGEIIICTTEDVDPWDDTNIATIQLDFPAVMVPNQNQPGSLNFMLAFPFSDYEDKLEIRKEHIMTLSRANSQLESAYEQWKTQVKAQMSNIIVPESGSIVQP